MRLQMRVGLHIKYRLLLSGFNESWNFFSHSFSKINIKFHENSSSVSRVIPCRGIDRRTYKHDEAHSRFSQFCDTRQIKTNSFEVRILSEHSDTREQSWSLPIWGITVPLPNLHARRDWVVNTMPRPLYPRLQEPYPLYMNLGGLQGPSRWIRKI